MESSLDRPPIEQVSGCGAGHAGARQRLLIGADGHAQAASGWQPLVHEWDRAENADVDVYYAIEGHHVLGWEILVAAPLEFTSVNIVGAIDLDQISTLRRTFVPGEQGPSQLSATTPHRSSARVTDEP